MDKSEEKIHFELSDFVNQLQFNFGKQDYWPKDLLGGKVVKCSRY